MKKMTKDDLLDKSKPELIDLANQLGMDIKYSTKLTKDDISDWVVDKLNEKASVKLSKRSWHYRLLKFVWGEDVREFNNLCPYYWLMVFNMFVVIFVAPIKGFVWIIDKFVDAILIPNAKSWAKNMSDMELTSLYDWEEKDVSKPFGYRFLGRGRAMGIWAEKNGIDLNTQEGQDKLYDIIVKNREEISDERMKQKEERRILKAKRLARTSKISEGFDDSMDSIGAFLSNIFSKITIDFSGIIRWTKRIVGLIITIIGTIGFFYIASWLVKGILWLVANWVWITFFWVIGIITAVVLFVLLIMGIKAWAEWINDKYNYGNKIWYVEILKWVVFYPIYYLVFWPVYIIFWIVICKFIFVTLIWGGLKLLWKAIMGFLGIFGEYFGASYTDYCPGIDWED